MLVGVKVLQFEGLAPTVFCSMYFADQGAQVILITRKDTPSFSLSPQFNLMNRGKKCISLSPKHPKQHQIIQQLLKISNIIIDPYRPGILQKLGLGPSFIYQHNKSAILLRVTGYGQHGQMSLKPGHDLNYLSVSGIIPLINGEINNSIYQFPTNYLADFVSSSLGITATLSALIIAKQTGIGRIVDCSMTHGAQYYAQIIHQCQQTNNKINNQVIYIKEGQHQYCIIKKKQTTTSPKQLIATLLTLKKDYHQTEQYSISIIKPLQQFKNEIKGLKNPFNINKLPNNLTTHLPTKNQHEKQIKQYVENYIKYKAKL